MVTFEFARVFKAYDYRTFFQHLLGPGWIAFELCYLALTLLVLAVVAAASGAIIEETFGVDYLVGVIGISVLVAALVFGGSNAIEKVFAAWSGVLYLVYGVFFVWCMMRFGPEIRAAVGSGISTGSWFGGGVQYAAYNLGVIPAVLFTIRHHSTRQESLWSGALTGPIAMAPALLFFLAISGQHPAILDQSVPANFMLELLGSRTFQFFFQIMLLGTLIETGTGLIHALNERLAQALRRIDAEEEDPPALSGQTRIVVAVVLLLMGGLVAQFGLIALIAKGYGTLTWLFLIVYVVPILTLGVVKIRRETRRESSG